MCRERFMCACAWREGWWWLVLELGLELFCELGVEGPIATKRRPQLRARMTIMPCASWMVMVLRSWSVMVDVLEKVASEPLDWDWAWDWVVCDCDCECDWEGRADGMMDVVGW